MLAKISYMRIVILICIGLSLSSDKTVVTYTQERDPRKSSLHNKHVCKHIQDTSRNTNLSEGRSTKIEKDKDRSLQIRRK